MVVQLPFEHFAERPAARGRIALMRNGGNPPGASPVQIEIRKAVQGSHATAADRLFSRHMGAERDIAPVVDVRIPGVVEGFRLLRARHHITWRHNLANFVAGIGGIDTAPQAVARGLRVLTVAIRRVDNPRGDEHTIVVQIGVKERATESCASRCRITWRKYLGDGLLTGIIAPDACVGAKLRVRHVQGKGEGHVAVVVHAVWE